MKRTYNPGKGLRGYDTEVAVSHVSALWDIAQKAFFFFIWVVNTAELFAQLTIPKGTFQTSIYTRIFLPILIIIFVIMITQTVYFACFRHHRKKALLANGGYVEPYDRAGKKRRAPSYLSEIRKLIFMDDYFAADYFDVPYDGLEIRPNHANTDQNENRVWVTFRKDNKQVGHDTLYREDYEFLRELLETRNKIEDLGA
jgi:hypothetical protein